MGMGDGELLGVCYLLLVLVYDQGLDVVFHFRLCLFMYKFINII